MRFSFWISTDHESASIFYRLVPDSENYIYAPTSRTSLKLHLLGPRKICNNVLVDRARTKKREAKKDYLSQHTA